MSKHRELFGNAAAAVASSVAWGQETSSVKLDRIAVMSSTFAPLLKGMARPGNPRATVDLMDLAGMVAERFGIHRVEFQQSDFPSTEPAYFEAFRKHMKSTDSQVSQISLEFANLNVSSPDQVIRLETIELTRRWIDYAAALGCPRVMVNQGDLAPAVRESAVATLKTINRYATAKNIAVVIGNRPHDVPWDVLVDVVRQSGIRMDPNSGNFADSQSRVAALAAMYPLTAGNSHIQHVPQKFDTAEAIRIAKQAGYQGIFTIETVPANGRDPAAAVHGVLDVLLPNI